MHNFLKRYKDGKEISTDSNIKIQRDSHRSESYSLTLNIVKGSDTGDYEVKVVNSMGEVSCKSRVIVQGKLLKCTNISHKTIQFNFA